MSFCIRPFTPEDWPQAREIYLQGIATGVATFETESPTWAKWDAAHLPFARMTARQEGGGTVLGWAALSPVSARNVYRGVVEISVYVRNLARGQGIGRALLEALVAESEKHEIWTLQASIFAENEPSLALHRACGFREVGRRERIAQLHGKWHDTVLMERRSGLI
jgi:L-amino acid N-acyltransferase YncA